MNFMELVESRYSVRAYKPDPVEDEKLQEVLHAAQLAPTAANRQAFGLVVIHTHGREAGLLRINPAPWFTQAPLLIAACGLPNQNWMRRDRRNYNDVDVTVALDHLVLAAASLGLGTCWVSSFDPDAAREVLQLTPEVEPIAFTPLGYAADQPRMKMRKALAGLVRYEHWQPRVAARPAVAVPVGAHGD